MPDDMNAAPWPPFLAPLRQVLLRAPLPEGPFDPRGVWEHRYRVCVLVPERGARGEHPNPYGTLSIARKPSAADRFSLDVDFSISTRGPSGMRTRASLSCSADRLATPLAWESRSDVVDKGKPVPEMSATETATFAGGVLVRKRSRERKTKVPGPFTTNWSLLEAVQRMPFDDPARLTFDMLEDLDLVKPGQSLTAIGPVVLDFGPRKVTLHGFRQTGHGILPTHYWLDDQHRVVAVAGSVRGLVWAGSGPVKEKS
jgi:hypothetical protein